MVEATITPSSDASRGSTTPGNWRTNLRHTPWIAIILVLLVLACMGAATGIIVISNNQTVESWKVQPAVLLAVLSSILGHGLSGALYTGVAIIWWKSALRGTSLERLHYVWGYGTGYAALPNIFAGIDANKVALVYAMVAIAKFVNNPLFQRSTQTVAYNVVTNDTMMLDVKQRLPDGWAALIGNGTLDTMIGLPNGLSTYQAWYRNETISTQNTPGYYCNGTCQGEVPGAGITYNCTSATVPLNLTTVGATVFAINFTMSEHSNGDPFLLMTTLYPSAINDACIATLIIDTCNISAATVKYPVTITNATVTLINTNGLQSFEAVSIFVDPGDLPSAPYGSGAGPLQGLYNFYGFYFLTNAVIGIGTGNFLTYIGGSETADLFYDAQVAVYDNATSLHCDLQWFSPTEWILNSLNDFMFRSALSSSNSSDVQRFDVQSTNLALVYHSDNRYLIVALVFILVAVGGVLVLLWGYWEVGRCVSLSPIETANAFQSRIMEDVPEVSIDGILKKAGKLSVRYDTATGQISRDDLDVAPNRARLSNDSDLGEGRLSGDGGSIQAESEEGWVTGDEVSPLSKETAVVHTPDEIQEIHESDSEEQQ